MNITNSERLSYELMTRDDAKLLFELDQDVEVMRYINGGNMTTMDEIHKKYIPRLESYTNTEKGWGLWKVTILTDATFIGWVLVRPMYFFSDHSEPENIELGWRFKRSSWGKGYATEAANSIKQALIELGGINKLSALAYEDNVASVKIMQKLGMDYIKTDSLPEDGYDDELVFYELEIS